MNFFIREIPLIEILLVFAILGLVGLGFFSLLHRKDPIDLTNYGDTGKWILASLMGLAFLATILLFVVSFVIV